MPDLLLGARNPPPGPNLELSVLPDGRIGAQDWFPDRRNGVTEL